MAALVATSGIGKVACGGVFIADPSSLIHRSTPWNTGVEVVIEPGQRVASPLFLLVMMAATKGGPS